MQTAGATKLDPVGPVTIASAVDWFVGNGFRLLTLQEEHLHTVAILEGREQPQ